MKQRKLATLIAGLAVFLNAATPAFAATFTISGNGSNSESFVTSTVEKDVDVNQDNDATVNNTVNVSANTGSNTAKDNTGGAVTIDTGSTDVGVQVTNNLNTNVASVDSCNGCGTDTTVNVTDNGTGTSNVIKTTTESDVDVDQDNDANVSNNVNVTGSSGDNSAKGNTGGEVEITTGSVTVDPVRVTNHLNTNAAVVTPGDSQGSTSLTISGNGSKSENYINLAVENDVDVDQDNDARVSNGVYVAGLSGGNTAKDNTGGEVAIDTGAVTVKTYVDTAANFNLADVTDCCLVDVTGKIDDNGTKSHNVITAALEDDLDVDQDNDLSCGHGSYDLFSIFGGGGSHGGKCNDVNVTADSGYNRISGSTEGDATDPLIDTGTATVEADVDTTGNVNHYGFGEFELPDGEGTSVDIDLDLGGVMSLLHEILDLLS